MSSITNHADRLAQWIRNSKSRYCQKWNSYLMRITVDYLLRQGTAR
ncbi:hypothetical protein HYE13_02860 [Mycoplasmopsis bovis]|nr:hypothetical protein HYE13_02860 [Mycoplasmopsis bovis]